MSNFDTQYRELLRRQVVEEISYLVRHGHDNGVIKVPCMFCIKRSPGNWGCARLNQLRHFLKDVNKDSDRDSELLPVLNHGLLPPIFP